MSARQHCHSSHVFSVNPRYLQEEWKAKMCSEQSFGNGVMNGWSPLVPQQDNYTDCGIYLLQYVESFLKVFKHVSFWIFYFFFFCILKLLSFIVLGPTTNFPLHHEWLVFTEDSEEEKEANQTAHSQTSQTETSLIFSAHMLPTDHLLLPQKLLQPFLEDFLMEGN